MFVTVRRPSCRRRHSPDWGCRDRRATARQPPPPAPPNAHRRNSGIVYGKLQSTAKVKISSLRDGCDPGMDRRGIAAESEPTRNHAIASDEAEVVQRSTCCGETIGSSLCTPTRCQCVRDAYRLPVSAWFNNRWYGLFALGIQRQSSGRVKRKLATKRSDCGRGGGAGAHRPPMYSPRCHTHRGRQVHRPSLSDTRCGDVWGSVHGGVRYTLYYRAGQAYWSRPALSQCSL